MIAIKLFPLDSERIINLDQIVEINRYEEIETEDNGKILDGAIIALSNGSEIILTSQEADTLFAHSFEQMDVFNQLKTKLGQP